MGTRGTLALRCHSFIRVKNVHHWIQLCGILMTVFSWPHVDDTYFQHSIDDGFDVFHEHFVLVIQFSFLLVLHKPLGFMCFSVAFYFLLNVLWDRCLDLIRTARPHRNNNPRWMVWHSFHFEEVTYDVRVLRSTPVVTFSFCELNSMQKATPSDRC